MDQLKNKLFRITADYRKNNTNKPIYYVAAKSKKEAKQLFSSKFSWLNIYGIEEEYDNEKCKDPLFTESIPLVVETEMRWLH